LAVARRLAAYFITSKTVCFLGKKAIYCAILAECLIFWQKIVSRGGSNLGENLAISRNSSRSQHILQIDLESAAMVFHTGGRTEGIIRSMRAACS
jgi:hypothetical protein